MWTLDEALVLVRELQPQLTQFEYHVALGGGVLNKGKSDNDLDLYFISFDFQLPENYERLIDFLKNKFGDLQSLVDKKYDNSFFKAKLSNKNYHSMKRIDFFIQ